MAADKVDDELWTEFHTVVNMTSRELNDWRRSDLTDDDAAAMTKVVETVRRERREDLEPTAGDDHWRHKLMDIGHDPLKPVGTGNGVS